MKLKRALRRDDGAAMVEFAIVFPILILLVIGIINFGYAWGQKNAVNSAARQGARAAVVEDSSGSTPKAKAQAAVDNTASPLATGMVVGTPTAAPTNGAVCGAADSVGKDMVITVTFPNPGGWLAPVPPFSSGPRPMTAKATYRCEY